MKTIRLSAFCLALMAATPAFAQSSFVMILGEAPSVTERSESAPASREQQIESAVEEACVRPVGRDLKAHMLYRECKAILGAEIAEADTTVRAPIQLAAR
ncbi:hypothetical protein [Aurantiacibacter hainanensis]|uniref:hypothetical protein n=1 Tax=Aurantiacibacter hainanensis TaxID=3076114 RepID=UPI0030C76BFB